MKIYKLCFLFVLVLSAFPVVTFTQKMKVEDVVAKHLDSIGTAETRAAVKTRVAVGEATVKFTSQKNLTSQGRIVLASAGQKNFWGIILNSVDYPSERFSFDGKKSKVGFVRPGVRSVLGNFILSNNVLLEESLFGGTLSNSWALLNLANSKAKLSFEGSKKIDGREVYEVGYSSKNGSDVDIILYFDKETFRHVRSEYKRISSAGIGTSPDQSSRFNETRFKLTEDFSDFKDEKGITLPHDYRVLYSVAGQNGTTEIEWRFKLNEFSFNQNLTANTFDAEAN